MLSYHTRHHAIFRQADGCNHRLVRQSPRSVLNKPPFALRMGHQYRCFCLHAVMRNRCNDYLIARELSKGYPVSSSSRCSIPQYSLPRLGAAPMLRTIAFNSIWISHPAFEVPTKCARKSDFRISWVYKAYQIPPLRVLGRLETLRHLQQPIDGIHDTTPCAGILRKT